MLLLSGPGPLPQSNATAPPLSPTQETIADSQHKYTITYLHRYTFKQKANLAKRELEESLSLRQSKEKERFQKTKK